MLVFTLGPERSRPFIGALHFFISIGFLTGTFLVQPFLPSKRETVCSLENSFNNKTIENMTTSEGINSEEELVIPQIYGIQSICWPFLLSGFWCVCVAFGFIGLSCRKSLEMPQFYDENTNTKHKDNGRQKLGYLRKRIFLAKVILFYLFSGGLIRVFQSMSTTFSMCGPLQLETHRLSYLLIKQKSNLHLQSSIDRHFLQFWDVLGKISEHIPIHSGSSIKISYNFYAWLHPLHMSSAVPSPTLLHQFVCRSCIHGLLSVMAICSCLFLDFSSYEHNWKTFFNIFHR